MNALRPFHVSVSCALALVLALSFSTIAMAGSPAATASASAMPTPLPKVSDPALLSLLGTWEGTCKMGNQSGAGPAEIVWKTTLNDQWIEATLHAWSDAAKKTMFFDARMYIRPTATPGTFKVYAVDNSGAGQTGSITIKDGTWQWTFAYDNGCKEVGSMDDPATGKVVYKGTVTDPTGQELMYVGFNLTKTKSSYSSK